MTRTQNMTETNDLDFFDEMKDVKPMVQDTRVLPSKPSQTLAQQLKRQAIENDFSKARNYLSVERVEPVDPLDYISYKKSGVQHGVFKNLRLGKYPVESVVNLQQMQFEAARHTLFNNIIEAHKRGTRVLLIKHGIGQNSKPFPAFLKSYAVEWLTQMPEVIAFHTAQRHHGGMGSVYVLLKKNSEASSENKELHRRK